MVMAYDALDGETRCFMLVGQFLWHWAYMENELNNAIAEALELKGYQKYIVTKNIQLRDKIKILKASVAVSLAKDDVIKAHQKTLNEIANFSHKRNMIAHDLFGPDHDIDGALFLRVTANDKVALSDAPWTIKDFTEAFATMDAFGESLKVIAETLSKQHNMRRIVELLINSPTLDFTLGEPPETAGPLYHFLRGLPYSPPPEATEETAPQTPEGPQE